MLERMELLEKLKLDKIKTGDHMVWHQCESYECKEWLQEVINV
jgi:hypothetical protein